MKHILEILIQLLIGLSVFYLIMTSPSETKQVDEDLEVYLCSEDEECYRTYDLNRDLQINEDVYCLAQNIFHEARSETIEGQLAVAWEQYRE